MSFDVDDFVKYPFFNSIRVKLSKKNMRLMITVIFSGWGRTNFNISRQGLDHININTNIRSGQFVCLVLLQLVTSERIRFHLVVVAFSAFLVYLCYSWAHDQFSVVVWKITPMESAESVKYFTDKLFENLGCFQYDQQHCKILSESQ